MSINASQRTHIYLFKKKQWGLYGKSNIWKRSTASHFTDTDYQATYSAYTILAIRFYITQPLAIRLFITHIVVKSYAYRRDNFTLPGSNRIFQNWTGNMQNSKILLKDTGIKLKTMHALGIYEKVGQAT